MDVIGITAVASYIPKTLVSNLGRVERAGKTREFIVDKIGFCHVARKETGEETSDLCVKAFATLSKRRPVEIADVDCLVVCTQNPDGHGLPNTASVVHAKLGLGAEVAAFDISLGCSGYVYGLNVIRSFMHANGYRNGLFFTADPYSKILDPNDFDTELLFGDAATVTYLSERPVYAIMKSRFASNGSLRHSIQVKPEDRKLSMLGSNVFKFTMTVVPEQIQACLGDNDLKLEDIDLFLLHQGSRFIVENMSRKLGIPSEKAPFEARDLGNTVSSTIPIMLEKRMSAPPKRILLCGFGVGLSWATTILERA
jgi:3-oxoacyl-[acyl-carrier-protein] synthase-3